MMSVTTKHETVQTLCEESKVPYCFRPCYSYAHVMNSTTDVPFEKLELSG